MKKHKTIVADPPWPSNVGGTWTARVDKARPQNQYPTLTVDEIASIPIPSADQAHLYLWITAQRVDWGYQVARAWGFAPVILWTWRKPGLGVGRFRCNTEHVLVARKGSRHGNPFGSGGRHKQATDGTCFDWPRGKHSEKPGEMFSLVENVSPGPYLELFGRKPRDGWTVWGNEVGDPLGIGFDPANWLGKTGEGAQEPEPQPVQRSAEGETDPRSAYMNARTCICGADARDHRCPPDSGGDGFDPDWEAMRERYFDLAPRPGEDTLREAEELLRAMASGRAHDDREHLCWCPIARDRKASGHTPWCLEARRWLASRTGAVERERNDLVDMDDVLEGRHG